MKILAIVLFLITIFNAQANTCPEGTYLVQEHPRQSYYKSNGTYVSSTTVSPYCRHYRDDGPLQEHFFSKKPNKWPHPQEKFDECSKEKQQIVSKILKSIPKILTNVGKLKIYCAQKSAITNNPATCAPEAKTIVLYDPSFSMDTKRVIAHELAHLLWSRLSDKEKQSYFDVSKWRKFDNIYIYNRVSFSAPDGKNGPEEDFANNIEYHLAEPVDFKNKFPQIDSWIKNFLGDSK